MSERMKFNPAAAAEGGKRDAHGLITALCNLRDDEDQVLSNDTEGNQSSTLLVDSLANIIGLAVENRIEEYQARLEAFSRIIGPALYVAGEALHHALPKAERTKCSEPERRLIDSAISTCCQVSAGRIIAAHPNDDDAIAALTELQMAVRAQEPKFTETEGGEM